MITKNKKQNGSSALVVSVMCAVILTIIRQSINNKDNTYASIASAPTKTEGTEVHSSAPISPYAQGSRNFLDDITAVIVEQKKLIDEYLGGFETLTTIEQNGLALPTYQSEPVTSEYKTPSIVSGYKTFEQIKKSFSDKNCEYAIPIDNTDTTVASHIQWGLQSCLLTVSSAQKVYPNDVLTHEMMRVIAQRAGFVVKMDYASNKSVSKEQLFTFFYALQQHHNIGNLPVVSVGTPVKRSEYIKFLHALFGDTHTSIVATKSNENTAPILSTSVQNQAKKITVKEFKEILIAQGKQIEITPYDDAIILTPEIMKSLVGGDAPVTPVTESIGLDKEMMKQTVSRLIEKI